jgi:MYND finger
MMYGSIGNKFDAMLSPVDGMPPLWPRAPRWYTDPVVKSRICDRLGPMLAVLLEMNVAQRQSDNRYNHLKYLASLYGSDDERPVDEWCRILLPPTGWADIIPKSNRRRVCSAKTFVGVMSNFLQLADPYTPPAAPIPRFCDECNQQCESECMCGEVYCSRACLREAWQRGHRDICEVVHDNGECALLANKTEMSMYLTKEEMDIAMGISIPSSRPSPATSTTSAASSSHIGRHASALLPFCLACNISADMLASEGRKLLRCTGCKSATYCSAECQKQHWKSSHKHQCPLLKKGTM